MEQPSFSRSHQMLRRRVKLDDRHFVHLRCRACGRDFVMVLEDPVLRWRAVHVGTFQFGFLNDEITERWVSADCPGRKLPGEANDDRLKFVIDGDLA